METFIKIQDYENYSISDKGNVMNNKTKKILKNHITHYGDVRVGLSINKKTKQFMIHRLMALCLIPNPKNKKYVKHIDGNKLNNSIENLKWVSYNEFNENKCLFE